MSPTPPNVAPSPLHQIVHKDPAFGYDAWLNPTPGASTAAAEFEGEDTIGQDVGLLTPGQALYASYVPPSIYAGWDQLVAWAKTHAPDAFLLSITIASSRARCGDFEPGAMATADFAHWYDTQAIHDDISVPWGYTNAANMQALINAAAGRKFVRFSAHYGFGPHICGPGTCGWPQADWTQWADSGPAGQNFDRSIGRILPAAPVPAAKPSGTARVEVSVDLASGKVTGLHPLPGTRVHFAGPGDWLDVHLQIQRGATHGGQWRVP
jgi:hypothetical protein